MPSAKAQEAEARPQPQDKTRQAKVEHQGPTALPAGKSGRSFRVIVESSDEDARDALVHSGGEKNTSGVFANVDLNQLEFKQPADPRIAECWSSDAAFSCEVLDGGQRIKIVPKSDAGPDLVPLKLTFQPRQIELMVRRMGPAAIRAEHVPSAGRSMNAVELGVDKTLLVGWSIKWNKDDKIRISVADPEFQMITGIKVDRMSVRITDDRRIDVPVSAEMKAMGMSRAMLK